MVTICVVTMLMATFRITALPAAAFQVQPKVVELEARATQDLIREMDELGTHFEAADVVGTFVLYNLQRNEYLAYNRARADSAYVPASTFKIFNALVALETRAVRNADEIIEWDGIERGSDTWDRDHSLRSAFKHSAVWFFQELARRIGEGRMWHYVQAAEYGNVNIDGGIDRFWLDGELKISAMQQVRLLRRLYLGDLPFSKGVMENVRDVMVVEEGDDYVLRAKTGWGQFASGQIGWWIGYVERGDDVYFFATNIDIRVDDDAPARVSVTRSILQELGIL